MIVNCLVEKVSDCFLISIWKFEWMKSSFCLIFFLQVAISRALASFWRYPYLDQSSLRALLPYVEWDRFVTLAESKSRLRVTLSYLCVSWSNEKKKIQLSKLLQQQSLTHSLIRFGPIELI
jgi:hypothetical protein